MYNHIKLMKMQSIPKNTPKTLGGILSNNIPETNIDKLISEL